MPIYFQCLFQTIFLCLSDLFAVLSLNPNFGQYGMGSISDTSKFLQNFAVHFEFLRLFENKFFFKMQLIKSQILNFALNIVISKVYIGFDQDPFFNKVHKITFTLCLLMFSSKKELNLGGIRKFVSI